MSWKSNENYCDYDILMYGAFCHPCLFGENVSRVIKHPSCISHAIAYSTLVLSTNWVGYFVGDAIAPGNSCVISACSTLCTGALIGSYAGDMRTKLRQKYGIRGSNGIDAMIHSICSPCAICQEAQEIRLRTEGTEGYEGPDGPDGPDGHGSYWKPVPQEMEKS